MTNSNSFHRGDASMLGKPAYIKYDVPLNDGTLAIKCLNILNDFLALMVNDQSSNDI